MIDFEKIEAEIDTAIDVANKSVLAEHPNANINQINETAQIAKAICLTALRSYHESQLDEKQNTIV